MPSKTQSGVRRDGARCPKEAHTKKISFDYFQIDAVVRNSAVSGRSLQTAKEGFGGGNNVIEQTNFTQLVRIGQMKSQQSTTDRICDRLHELYLILYTEPNFFVFYFVGGELRACRNNATTSIPSLRPRS
jgi:hypothetical protein